MLLSCYKDALDPKIKQSKEVAVDGSGNDVSRVCGFIDDFSEGPRLYCCISPAGAAWR